MSEYRNGDLRRIEVTQEVQTDRTVRTIRGGLIRPIKIVHRAYIYNGHYYRHSLLLDDEGDNVSIDSADHSWPKPPHWFEVEALRLKLCADELEAVIL